MSNVVTFSKNLGGWKKDKKRISETISVTIVLELLEVARNS